MQIYDLVQYVVKKHNLNAYRVKYVNFFLESRIVDIDFYAG